MLPWLALTHGRLRSPHLRRLSVTFGRGPLPRTPTALPSIGSSLQSQGAADGRGGARVVPAPDVAYGSPRPSTYGRSPLLGKSLVLQWCVLFCALLGSATYRKVWEERGGDREINKYIHTQASGNKNQMFQHPGARRLEDNAAILSVFGRKMILGENFALKSYCIQRKEYSQ